MPFSNSWSIKKKVVVLKKYFAILEESLKEFRTFTTMNEFVQRSLLRNRYLHLKNDLIEHSDLYGDFDTYSCYLNTVFSSQAELPELEEKIRPVVEEQVSSFHKLAAGVFEISLADYVEELAR